MGHNNMRNNKIRKLKTLVFPFRHRSIGLRISLVRGIINRVTLLLKLRGIVIMLGKVRQESRIMMMRKLVKVKMKRKKLNSTRISPLKLNKLNSSMKAKS